LRASEFGAQTARACGDVDKIAPKMTVIALVGLSSGFFVGKNTPRYFDGFRLEISPAGVGKSIREEIDITKCYKL